jgi:HEAT repeat protein
MVGLVLLGVLLSQDSVDSVMKSLNGNAFECDGKFATALSGLGPKKELIGVLRKAIEQTEDTPEGQRRIENHFHALAHLKSEEARVALLQELKCESPYHSGWALHVLGHIDHPDVKATLLDVLAAAKPRDYGPDLAAVIRSLTQLREKKAIPGLLKILDGDHFLTLEVAANALGSLGDAETGTAIARRIKTAPWIDAQNYEVAKAEMLAAAARLGRKEFEPDLDKMMENGEIGVPETASRYFLSQGDLKGAKYFLEAMRRSEDRRQARSCYQELRLFFPQRDRVVP